MIISAIVAVTENWVIGRDNAIPWHMPRDLRWFKDNTSGHHVLLGRKNYDSIGKALPNRVNIVVSKNPSYHNNDSHVFHSIEEGMDFARKQGEQELFILGGEQIYKYCLPFVDRLLLTIIHTVIEGDTYFPEINWSNWTTVFEEHHKADERNPFDHTFFILSRKA